MKKIFFLKKIRKFLIPANESENIKKKQKKKQFPIFCTPKQTQKFSKKFGELCFFSHLKQTQSRTSELPFKKNHFSFFFCFLFFSFQLKTFLKKKLPTNNKTQWLVKKPNNNPKKNINISNSIVV